jgi:NitT/TauT family transport system ATP-binding protein
MNAEPAGPVFELSEVGLSLPVRGGTRDILRGLSFALGAGEILSIVGASGTGKTSLLRVIGGLTAQTAGTVRFCGAPVSGPPEGVAFVFQDYSNALLQWRTVAGNVRLGIGAAVRGKAREARIDEALALVGLARNRDDYPWQLSGGMQQRVQLARALARKPSVLLMDEPFASLDAMTKAGLQDELLRVREETGASIIFITHDIEEAIYIGDRVALLGGSPGRIEKTFEVALPFPRDQVTTREAPAFLALRHEIHGAFGRAGRR